MQTDFFVILMCFDIFCIKFAPYLHHISTIFPPYFHHICTIFAPYLQHICIAKVQIWYWISHFFRFLVLLSLNKFAPNITINRWCSSDIIFFKVMMLNFLSILYYRRLGGNMVPSIRQKVLAPNRINVQLGYQCKSEYH